MDNALRILILAAGMLVIPAVSISIEIHNPTVDFDSLSTSALERIASYEWFESRGYIDLHPEKRYREMIQDLSFDAWLAGKARDQGTTLTRKQMEILSQQKKAIQYRAAVEALIPRMEASEGEVRRHAAKWTTPLPERWEVFYLFIDTTGVETKQEQEKLHKRARWIKEQLTPGNFMFMAKMWSDAPSSTDGGYLGGVTLQDTGPTFTSHIKQTPVGTIGGPYPTGSGWNIFYVKSHTPQKDRNYPPEQLRLMTKKVKAVERVEPAIKSEEDWKQLIQEMRVLDDPEVQAEMAALENLMISGKYLYEKTLEKHPTDQDLEMVYKEHKSRFILGPSRKAREILLTSDDWSQDKTRQGWLKRRAVRDRARKLREGILNGADFAEMARKYSASQTASSGGDLGWIQQPSYYLIDMALANLEKGEISPPVAFPTGYLLLQLLDVEEDKLIPFSKARKKCQALYHALRKREIQEQLYSEFLLAADSSQN